MKGYLFGNRKGSQEHKNPKEGVDKNKQNWRTTVTEGKAMGYSSTVDFANRNPPKLLIMIYNGKK